jgi:predicted enzyme related to lactoylglutathione lyase
MATKKKTSARPAARKAATAAKPTAAPKRTASRPPARSGAAGTLKLDEIAPGLTANDIHESIAFYEGVLGFTVKQRWEQDGQLRGVELVAGKSTFMLGQDDWKKGRDRVKGEGVRLYCETSQDIDALAKQIKAAGGRLTQEPTTHPEWGMRDLAVEDPNGFKITIGKQIKHRKR